MAERSRDPAALTDVVLAAHKVRVFDGGMSADSPLGSDPVLTIADGAGLAELAELMAVGVVTDGHCMCPGDSVLEFVSGGRRLAVVAVHHMTSLRWSTWQGDALLADGRALAIWLAARGYPAPLERAEAADARQSRAATDEEAWRHAAPVSVLPVMDALVSTSQSGVVPEELVAEVDERLTADEPSEVARCRELLAWYGSGTGRVSGYPVHEGIPGRILARVPTATIAVSLTSEPADEAVWSGALRHLAGWRTRSDAQLREISPELWDRLEAFAAERGDTDVSNRLMKNRARVGG